MNKKEELASIGEIVKEKQDTLYLLKSTLHYWTKLGLLKPVHCIGKMDIFNKKETIETIKKIRAYQDKGMKLGEIKKILDENSKSKIST